MCTWACTAHRSDSCHGTASAQVALASRFEIESALPKETYLRLTLLLQHRERKSFRIFKANRGWEILPYPNHVKDNLISLITIYDMPAETKVTVFQTVRTHVRVHPLPTRLDSINGYGPGTQASRATPLIYIFRLVWPG